MSLGDDRTEEATPRRRAASLAQGISAHSPLIQSALALLMAALPCWVLLGSIGGWGRALQDAARTAVSDASGAGASALFAAIGVTFERCRLWSVIAAAGAAACVAALGAAMACGSVRFSMQALRPSLARITGKVTTGRFISQESIAQTGASALVVTLLAAIALPTVARAIAVLAKVAEPIVQAGVALGACGELWSGACAVLAGVALIDVVVQRRRHSVRLKMTPREVREERAQTEGRPEVKQRRRALGAKRARSLQIAAIRRATAVLTNPTHVAVALRYAPPEVDVPTIVARGANLMAPVVRAAARTFGVPVIEAPALARQLYDQVDIDEPIPEECYAAVAAVFSWILQTHGVLLRGDEGKG